MNVKVLLSKARTSSSLCFYEWNLLHIAQIIIEGSNECRSRSRDIYYSFFNLLIFIFILFGTHSRRRTCFFLLRGIGMEIFSLAQFYYSCTERYIHKYILFWGRLEGWTRISFIDFLLSYFFSVCFLFIRKIFLSLTQIVFSLITRLINLKFTWRFTGKIFQ